MELVHCARRTSDASFSRSNLVTDTGPIMSTVRGYQSQRPCSVLLNLLGLDFDYDSSDNEATHNIVQPTLDFPISAARRESPEWNCTSVRRARAVLRCSFFNKVPVSQTLDPLRVSWGCQPRHPVGCFLFPFCLEGFPTSTIHYTSALFPLTTGGLGSQKLASLFTAGN